MEPPEQENKLLETLRYVGYTIGAIIGIVILGLIALFIEDVIIWVLDFFFTFVCLVVIGIAVIGVIYGFLQSMKND